MPAYLTVRQIGWREHGQAGRVHRRPQQEVGDGCGLELVPSPLVQQDNVATAPKRKRRMRTRCSVRSLFHESACGASAGKSGARLPGTSSRLTWTSWPAYIPEALESGTRRAGTTTGREQPRIVEKSSHAGLLFRRVRARFIPSRTGGQRGCCAEREAPYANSLGDIEFVPRKGSRSRGAGQACWNFRGFSQPIRWILKS